LLHLAEKAIPKQKAELYNQLGLYYSDEGRLDKAIAFLMML